MPERQFITPLDGVKVIDLFEGTANIVIRGLIERPKDLKCPRCSGIQIRIKTRVRRKLKHGMWNNRLVWLDVQVPKYLCRTCRRYFMASIPGVLPRRRATEQFRQEIFHIHQAGVTQLQLTRTHRISCSTVERWYQDFVAYRVKELDRRSAPLVIGIDEHFFTKKQGYATTLVDLRNHKVFDVVLGRDEASLGAYLKALPGREKVLIVVMDLSEPYRRIVQKYFPNARIVADRFHVIRWINHQFMKTWGDWDPDRRKNRGLISLIRRHPWNLSEEQKIRVQSYFDETPGLKAVYEFKTGLGSSSFEGA